MSYFQKSNALPAWIGKPPIDWRTDWLKWHVSRSTERPTDEEVETLPYIANEDIASWTGQLLNPDPKPADADSRKFQRDDVLFNKLRPYLAKVFHAPFAGVSSGELLCLRGGGEVHPRYLFYVVSSKAFVDAVNAETFGSKMPRADWEIVGHQPLPLPPFETQKRIADFLDGRMARIEALISNKRALVERLAEKQQAIISRAVTKGLDPAAPTRDSGVAWLGEIPAHWEVRPVYAFQRRITYGFTNPMPTSDDGPYMLTANDIGYGEIKYTSARMTDQEAFENELTDKSRPEVGDILITKDGTLGRAAMYEGPSACINQSVALLRVSSDTIKPRFALYCLLSDPYQEEMIVNAGGTTIKHIYISRLSKMAFAFPGPKEQAEIIDYCSNVFRHFAETKAAIESSIAAMIEYRSAIIISAVTGQIEDLQ